MNPQFWRGKRVFLTGHTGFKGGWLTAWLHELDAEVTGYALAPPTQPNLFDTIDVARDIRSIIGDIRDVDRLKRDMAKAQPEIVIHMAAQSLVRYSYLHPVDTYAINVMGTVNLLESIRATSGVRAVINVTSDKCYENRDAAQAFREDSPMGGYDPYSSSKGCAELITAAYRNSFFSPQNRSEHTAAIATARAGNVIGGGDWAQDRLIPDILRAIEHGTPAQIRNPDAIRPWQHVLEPLSGYLALAEKLYGSGAAYAEGWNFGPDHADAKPVRWIADHMVRLWGNGAAWRADAAPQPHEAATLRLDCTKAREQLGWHPRWNIATAIEKTIEWHRAYRQGKNMRRLTLAQINEYQNMSDTAGHG